MNENRWLSNYFDKYRQTIFQPEICEHLTQLKALVKDTQKAGKKVILAGNGGSAAMASHCAVDLTKTAGVRSVNFNEADLITCFANDYGYENWLAKALEFYAEDGDLIILISSSGKSPNMLQAADYAQRAGLPLVTFTGFSATNPLRTCGKLNFWVDSDNYNLVENTHLIWILALCDLIVAERNDSTRDESLMAKTR